MFCSILAFKILLGALTSIINCMLKLWAKKIRRQRNCGQILIELHLKIFNSSTNRSFIWYYYFYSLYIFCYPLMKHQRNTKTLHINTTEYCSKTKIYYAKTSFGLPQSLRTFLIKRTAAVTHRTPTLFFYPTHRIQFYIISC